MLTLPKSVPFGLGGFWNKRFSYAGHIWERKLYAWTVNFQLSNFNAKASFSSAAFDGPASFLSSIFSKAALFSSATFGEKANFWGTVFDDHVSFLLAVFNRTVLFWDTAFNETTDFAGAVLGQPASFTGATFRENTVFVGLWNDILCPTIQSITAGRANLKKKVVTDFSSLACFQHLLESY